MEQFQTSMTENFFQELTTDVFDKYEITDEICDGEFGPIYKVRPKDPSVHTVRVYSLKTIHLNRVSRQELHQKEVLNEIAALKVCCDRGMKRMLAVTFGSSFFTK